MYEHTKKFIISVFGCERRRKKGYNSQEHHQTKHHEDEVKLRKRAKCCTLLHTYNDDKDTVYRPFILVCHHTTIKQSTSSSSPSRSHTRLPTKHQEQYHHRSYGSECSFPPFALPESHGKKLYNGWWWRRLRLRYDSGAGWWLVMPSLSAFLLHIMVCIGLVPLSNSLFPCLVTLACFFSWAHVLSCSISVSAANPQWSRVSWVSCWELY